MKTKNCSACGAEFTCGPVSEKESCWCSHLPNIMPLDFSKDCMCQDCLKKVIKEKEETRKSNSRKKNHGHFEHKAYWQKD